MKNKTLTCYLTLICIFLITIVFSSCGETAQANHLEQKQKHNRYNLVIIDSCEYLEGPAALPTNWNVLTHKGNCKFCKQRNLVKK